MKYRWIVFLLLVCVLALSVGCDCTGGDDDDDNDDGHHIDDDTADNETFNEELEATFEYVAGGVFSGAALALDPTGTSHVITLKSRRMLVYSPAGVEWTAAEGPFGAFANPSAAYGPDGVLHVAYYDWYGGYLWHASNPGGIWSSEIVDQNGDVGHYSAIAVGEDNIVHIAYNREVSRQPLGALYARCANGVWSFETIEDAEGLGAFPSLAVDSAGVVYVSYNDAINETIHVARRSGGTWDAVVIDDAQPYNRASAVAVDSLDKLHLVYRAVETVAEVVYLTGTWGATVREVIDNTTAIGDSLALAVDASNVAHVTYFNSADATTMYATNATKAWVTQKLGAGYPVAIRASMTDDVTISIGDIGVWQSGGGAWEAINFDRGYFVDDCAIAADRGGRLHILYIDHTAQALRYAVREGGLWQTEVLLEVIGGDARDLALAVDDSQVTHMSFYNDLTHELVYGTNGSGAWEFTALDSEGVVGTHSSLVIDANGAAHIAYHDETYGALKYATNQNGLWQTAIVDDEGVVGTSTAINVVGGVVYIAYADASDGDVNLAQLAPGGSWSSETVSQSAGDHISLISNTTGDEQYLLYVDAGLQMAARYKGDWFAYSIDPTAVSAPTSAVFDEHPYAAYQGAGRRLQIAAGRGETWVHLTADDTGDVGSHVALVRGEGSDQHLYVAYVAEGALWLATVTRSDE